MRSPPRRRLRDGDQREFFGFAPGDNVLRGRYCRDGWYGADSALWRFDFHERRDPVFNSKVYQDLFIGTIINAIEDDRVKQRAAIETNKTKEPVDYSFAAALRDAVDYHNRCAFYHGLVLMHDAVEKQKDTRPGLLDQIIRLNSEIDARVKERDGLPNQGKGADGKPTDEWKQLDKTVSTLRNQRDALYQRLGATTR